MGGPPWDHRIDRVTARSDRPPKSVRTSGSLELANRVGKQRRVVLPGVCWTCLSSDENFFECLCRLTKTLERNNE